MFLINLSYMLSLIQSKSATMNDSVIISLFLLAATQHFAHHMVITHLCSYELQCFLPV